MCLTTTLLALILSTGIFTTDYLLLPAQSAQPDIVLIVADDLGWGDLGCFGAQDLQTPALDTLASSGQRWTNFYANCCVCSPTRASILTGCYPDRVGVPGVIRTHANNSWGNFADVPTLPDLLSDAGYQTACIGKWHLGLEKGAHPLDRGFDTFHGFLGDMMDDYFNHLRHGNNYMRRGRREITPEGHATALFASWASQAVEQMCSKQDPYFLYLAFNAPHTPIQPPADKLAQVRKRLAGTSEQRAKLVALIEDMDTAIGQVLETVRSQNRDTLIVFVSDNGGQLSVGANNGDLRDGKQSMYEGGLRVPAIFNWPGKIPAGSHASAIGVTMDLLPTIGTAAGTAIPDSIDGLPLNRWIEQPDLPQAEREVYFVRREGGLRYAGLTIEALRQGDWKLVHNLPTKRFELYQLQDDPREQTDLASTRPAQFRRMMQTLQHHIQRGGRVPWQPDFQATDH